MTKSRVTTWLRPGSSAPAWTATVLTPISAAYVPLHLRDLEAWKLASLWGGPTSYPAAYDALNLQGIALLTDVTDRIINEVRALRNGQDTAVLDRNPALDPYTLDLASLRSLERRLQTATGEQAGALLGQIRDILLQQGTTDGDQLDALLQIVALLAV